MDIHIPGLVQVAPKVVCHLPGSCSAAFPASCSAAFPASLLSTSPVEMKVTIKPRQKGQVGGDRPREHSWYAQP